MRTIEPRITVIRNGADLFRLIPVSTPTITMSESGEIKTSLSGEFLQDDRLDYLTDEIKAELIINGETYPYGVYLPTTVTPSETDTAKTVSIEAYDRCWQVQSTVTESLLHISAGTAYLTQIKQLLVEAGIELLIETPSTLKIADDREDWETGTSYLTIINQLLSEINYKPLYFNENGYAMLQPKEQPSAENIKHRIDADKSSDCVLLGISRSMDIFSTPNVFICICSNPDKSGAMTAKAENTNPQSPLSISRRGRRIAQVYKIDNIANQEALQEYANNLRNASMQTGEQIYISTGCRDWHGIGDTVALHYGGINSLCKETEWSISLEAGGTMAHTLERVVYNIE